MFSLVAIIIVQKKCVIKEYLVVFLSESRMPRSSGEAEYDGYCAKNTLARLLQSRSLPSDGASSQTSSSQLQAGANSRTDVGWRIRGRGTCLTTRFLPGRFGWLSIGRSHRGHSRRNKVENVV